MTMISRDPFARTELHDSRPADLRNATCDWCGQKHPRGMRVFRTESDGGRVSTHRGKFCSKSCHDSYHN